jgi:hypothetical protein
MWPLPRCGLGRPAVSGPVQALSRHVPWSMPGRADFPPWYRPRPCRCRISSMPPPWPCSRPRCLRHSRRSPLSRWPCRPRRGPVTPGQQDDGASAVSTASKGPVGPCCGPEGGAPAPRNRPALLAGARVPSLFAVIGSPACTAGSVNHRFLSLFLKYAKTCPYRWRCGLRICGTVKPGACADEEPSAHPHRALGAPFAVVRRGRADERAMDPAIRRPGRV